MERDAFTILAKARENDPTYCYTCGEPSKHILNFGEWDLTIGVCNEHFPLWQKALPQASFTFMGQTHA